MLKQFELDKRLVTIWDKCSRIPNFEPKCHYRRYIQVGQPSLHPA